MSGTVIVVPTSRSQRRLVELLLDHAEQHRLIFTPPEIMTIGSFPERLYTPKLPLAGRLTQTLAWVKALQNTPTAELLHFTGKVPNTSDSMGWQMLAQVIAQWYTELAANGLNFKDVLHAGNGTRYFREQDRWETLCQVERGYLDVLSANRLWDRQSARLLAIQKRECQIDKQVYLVGTVDLNPVFRQMLDQIAEKVTAVVFAGTEDQESFDELGCLKVEAWENAVIPIADSMIQIGDQPQDQARLAARFLQQLEGEFGIDQVSISVPDPRLVSPISRCLVECGVKTHDVGGSSIGNSRAFVMLELLANWLDDQQFESFAALVRHPDIYAWVGDRVASDQWLVELDHYQNKRLPFYMPTDATQVYFGDRNRHGKELYGHLQRAYQSILELVQPLIWPERRPLAEWSGPWRQILGTIYKHTVVNRYQPDDRRTIRACRSIVTALIEIEESGHLLEGQVSSVEAVHWGLNLCSDQFVADPAIPEAISLVGWLDTALEDTPVCIVCSLNEGMVPSTEGSSLFLPNSVRSALGLVDNQRRYARDAYALKLILACRDRVLLTVGRRDGDGQPLMPSRLLMTGERETIAARVLKLFQDGESTAQWTLGQACQRPAKQQFVIPDPTLNRQPVNNMRVTDFRQYLACPYRFYLSRVLNLQRLADDQDEMDAAQFGSLIHDVVENFGRSSANKSQDPVEIQDHLLDCLNRFSQARYGRNCLPAVQIQLQQARIRLRAFAIWQAQHRADGYEIFEVEREKTRCEFLVDGQPFVVSGQIDRIDVNHDLRKIGLYDYKTGDKGEKPEQTHRRKDGTWKDLQLPLYHDLLQEFDLPADYEIETGLILIAKDVGQVSLHTANWSPAELAAAKATAFDVMRKVRAGQFWPPAELNAWWDDFAAICQSRVFEKWVPPQGGNNA